MEEYVYKSTAITGKYPLRRYTMNVLTHTTALDQHWEGDETLRCCITVDRNYLLRE